MRVIVDVPDEPTGTLVLAGLAEMLKSGGGFVTSSVTRRVCTSVPLAPLIVMVQYPVGVDWPTWAVSVDAADPPEIAETLDGLSETLVVLAIVGFTVAESVTVPAKPSRLFTVIVAVVVEPCGTVSFPGFEDMLKSGVVLLESLQAVSG